jgi:replicative DNA helicase
LFKNFDNHGIMGDSSGFDSEPYRKYINTLTKKDLPIFDVTTPIDFDKYVTVTKLRNWVKERKLDAIVIDGLQYLANERGCNKKNTPENLTEIAEDLMILSTEMRIPVIAVHQANREGARDRDGEVNTEAPELDTIRGSDGISHNASRALSVYKSKDMVKLYLSKNRYGSKGQHLFYHYDVNFGKFTYTPNPKDGIAIDTAAEAESFSDDKGSPF